MTFRDSWIIIQGMEKTKKKESQKEPTPWRKPSFAISILGMIGFTSFIALAGFGLTSNNNILVFYSIGVLLVLTLVKIGFTLQEMVSLKQVDLELQRITLSQPSIKFELPKIPQKKGSLKN